MMLIQLSIGTRDGEFLAGYSDRGLAQLRFPTSSMATHRPATSRTSPAVRFWHRTTKTALNAILSGRAPRAFPPLDLSAGTPFQQSVWRILERIPVGQTCSYGEIARALGNPKGVRAVGRACGANPIPVLVPCHRVLAAHQKIGGFGGGLEWKRTLLAREGVKV
jgi:methylated-DNA-[protein]-cysteine S-methyltransferase